VAQRDPAPGAAGGGRGGAPWARLALAAALLIVVAGGLVVVAPRLLHGQAPAVPAGPTPTPLPPVDCAAVDPSGWHLAGAGQLVIASDAEYPPAEFADPRHPNQYDGYDLDLAREIARRLCLKPRIAAAVVDRILPGLVGAPLGAQTYDIAISSFTITPALAQQVDLVPYFAAGESILVGAGDPLGIHALADLCGRTVAAQNGTFELGELQAANGASPAPASGQPICQADPIAIRPYDTADQMVAQVLQGHAVAAYADQPVVDYAVSRHPRQLASAGVVVAPQPQGIAVRKDDPALGQAIRKALDAMRADGTYLDILRRWGVQAEAYPPLSPGA
jgi:polar amino acid transport system substrate-binding protein